MSKRRIYVSRIFEAQPIIDFYDKIIILLLLRIKKERGNYMIYNEQKGNLFDLDDKYALAHCISYDTDNPKSWNLGIVVEFKKSLKG